MLLSVPMEQTANIWKEGQDIKKKDCKDLRRHVGWRESWNVFLLILLIAPAVMCNLRPVFMVSVQEQRKMQLDTTNNTQSKHPSKNLLSVFFYQQECNTNVSFSWEIGTYFLSINHYFCDIWGSFCYYRWAASDWGTHTNLQETMVYLGSVLTQCLPSGMVSFFANTTTTFLGTEQDLN